MSGRCRFFIREVIPVPTVDCKLTDCAKHGRDICIAKRIGIDGVGQVECYEPVQRSPLVHGFNKATSCKKRSGKRKQRILGVLK